MTEIELNGASYCVPQGHSVQDLADQLGMAEQAVAVAVNREVLPRAQWQQRQLQARDKVEIVRAIGGG